MFISTTIGQIYHPFKPESNFKSIVGVTHVHEHKMASKCFTPTVPQLDKSLERFFISHSLFIQLLFFLQKRTTNHKYWDKVFRSGKLFTYAQYG
jgi:hypothetical protein